MTRVVLDASVVAAAVLPDELSIPAVRVVNGLPRTGGIVPSVWPFEIRTTLLSAERKGRITPTAMDSLIAIIERLPVEIDGSADFQALIALARAHRLTIYDAAYLELAKRLGAPLATLDAALARAAKAENVAAA